MSKSKDKRIKRLKKMRIWPSILGLLFISIIFTFVFALVIAFTCIDIVQRKLIDGSNQATKIASLYEEYNEATASDIHETVTNYIDLTSEITAVSVANANGDKIWSSSGFYPATDDISELEITEDDSSSIRFIIAEDKDQIFTYENGQFDISEDFFDKLDFSKAFESTNFFEKNENNSLTHFKLWYVVSVDNLEVYILNDIHIYGNDLFMTVVSITLFSVLLLVFAMYYIISFISVIANVHKTNQIIYTDIITGGDNWLHFVKKGTSLLKQNRKHKYNYAVLHLKMRKYRSFCTCFGVQEGEDLIEKFYITLKKKMNRKEVMAHRENAEFGLLVTYTDKEQLTARIHELEYSLDAVLPNMKIYFGAGVYLTQSGDTDIDQLYNNALIACEMSGEEADNKIAFFDVEMNKQKLWERKVEDDMDRALVNKEFKVYLQPKINTNEGQLGGAEALVRWIHPTEGFIPPNKFIPIFEQNGFILKLDDYMLEEIAKQQAQWIAEGRSIVPISVNVSRAHFTREDLAEHICAIVDRYQVPHNVIELELTESAFFDDKSVLLNTVKKLRDSGFIVSMDDFGAGYSSLNSLKELPIDVLKIDADFFRGTDIEDRGLLIVSEVIDLAKKLNMKIVAEGIESQEQVDFLTAQECDLIQGYFYAKPMPIDEFVEKYN